MVKRDAKLAFLRIGVSSPMGSRFVLGDTDIDQDSRTRKIYSFKADFLARIAN